MPYPGRKPFEQPTSVSERVDVPLAAGNHETPVAELMSTGLKFKGPTPPARRNVWWEINGPHAWNKPFVVMELA